MEAWLLAAIALLGGFGAAFVAGRAACASIEHAVHATSGLAFSGMSSAEAPMPAFLGGDARRAVAWMRRIGLYYMRNGVASLSPIADALVASRAGGAFRSAARLLRAREIETTPNAAASLAVGGVAFVTIASLVTFRSLAAALCSAALAVALLQACFSRAAEKERTRLREQVPDALRCMEACLHAGLSLPQAFYEVSAQIEQPARGLFAKVSRDLDLGYSVNEALERFRSVAELPELSFVAMALDVQYACGGSATPILRSAEESVSRDLELRRSLRVQTAQAKLSAQIVGVMPFALVFVISAVDPGFLAPFFASALGVALLAVAIGMLLAGVLAVRRILAIEI